MRRLVALSMAIVLLGAGETRPAAAPPPHPALAHGVALLRDGDFEAAVIEIDAAARKLEADPGAGAQRAWAYVYLGVAYLELEQEGVARAKFREALARDPALRLEPAQFSAQSIRIFEGVRAEAAAIVPAARPVAPSPPAAKGSKGPLVVVLVGGAAAAGAAIALSGGGGGGGGAATTSTTPVGEGPTTTTTTTIPAPTTPTTTQPPTTTPPAPSCRYDVSGQVNVPLTGCIGCSCSVSATPSTCGWNARTSDGAMITITRGSGSGDGNVIFNVSPSLSQRTGRITLAEGGGTCTVSQGVLFAPKR